MCDLKMQYWVGNPLTLLKIKGIMTDLAQLKVSYYAFMQNYENKDWPIKKNDKSISTIFNWKQIRTNFTFLSAFSMIIWAMAATNSFEIIPILKTWQLVFFWGYKTYFGILHQKYCIFRHKKINILAIICHSFWSI